MPTKRPKRPAADSSDSGDGVPRSGPSVEDTPAAPLTRGSGRGAALDYLKKQIGKRLFEGRVQMEGISTGSVAVDHVCGNGGFPRGRVSEVFGLEGSGKSTLCMSSCASAQMKDLYAVYVDVERSLIPEHARKLGFDCHQPGAWLQPDTFEETLTIIDTMAEKGQADIILVDSVPALVPEAVMKGDITEMGQFGQAARLFAGALPRLTKLIERTGTALVFVNQLRANIVTDQWRAKFEPKEKSFGGYALRYYSSLRVELRQKDKKAKVRDVAHPTEPGRTIEEPVASRHTATVFKSKVSQPYREIEFFIRYDPVADQWGIDNLQTRIDIARGRGILDSRPGGVTYYTTASGDKQTFRGAEQVYDWFQARPEEIAALTSQLGV